ncbi:ras-associating and dilute domain-containing protein-like [Boleophthalmus pectinirostris]|uniref:ras-associating and dilute domain-containing protein-like n=1 Tax=Boleophthalmus pectinirostris TaxID=150288 RepID=UPI00242A49BD|nr:ras-associating and dilute domain-containing protein-like [Boleophthalmus pectinirostris]
MMISEERSSPVNNKQSLNLSVGLLIRSPKRRLAKLGRKPSNGSMQSTQSDSTVRSSESVGVRQPAKSKIRRHNNRLSSVFGHSPNLRDSRAARRGNLTDSGSLGGDLHANDDPSELSHQKSAPGILKIFGSDICQGTNYKSVLATIQSEAKELVKEALERYCLEKEEPGDYVLCDVIGRTVENHWKRECFRVVGDAEKPLLLQSLWKPKDGFSRRFEIQRRASVEEQSLKNRDTVTAGLNAQVRKLQKTRSRVASLFVDGSGEGVDGLGLWRSLSDMDVSTMGKEALRAQQSQNQNQNQLREEQEAEVDKEELRLGQEKEETESSDDNTTQYSIHPPFDFPYFLLLQGYNHRQDFVIYLMSGTTTIFGCCQEHSNGEDEERLKVDILLFAPDVLPQHCCVRRLDCTNSTSATGESKKSTTTMLKPLHGAPVTRNGFLLKDEVELSPGDLVGLGKHYLFMFKDPTSSSTSPQTPPWMTKLCPNSDPKTSCFSCDSPQKLTSKFFAPCWRDLEGREAAVSYDLNQEEEILEKILTMLDPSGSEPKLTPAFLLSLCIQHSASTFELAHLRQLLLRIASQIQQIMWDKTKELAAIQPETDGGAEPELSTESLIPGLRPLVLWMANSIELLHFIQHEVPQLLPYKQDQEDQALLDSELSSTRTACEEAMTVLEEVIMFTFQQSVYYITKSMYSALPGLLEGNPFSDTGQLKVPEGLGHVLDVLKEALKLLTAFQVHPDISLQLCAYLFFFINASLFNALMERGSVVGFYQWSRGVQIRANLDLLMDFTQSIGLSDVAAEFFQKLSAAVNLLATPKETLLQASWSSLRAEFAALNPAQLHHMLREYSSTRTGPPCWSPAGEDRGAAHRTADILESFDNHPPLILPSATFNLELGKPIVDQGLFEQLTVLQRFIQQLAEKDTTKTEEGQQTLPDSQSLPQACSGAPPDPDQDCPPAEPIHPRGPHSDLGSCEAELTHKLKSLEIQSSLPGPDDRGSHKSLALDPSCLLTPPNTPQGMELNELESDLREGASLQRKANESGERRLEEEEVESEEVFTVELQKGPQGLGLALVDGTKTPLQMSGIYVKSVVPESPAARCLKLKVGDRILAVNGISLVGMEYSIGKELIRSSGDILKLLVAKIDPKIVNKTTITTKC